MIDRKPQLVAPLTAAALIAQQVGANAIRDGLFLSLFAVQSLPYFIAAAAVLAIVAAHFSGRLLTRLGPTRVVPALVAANAALFLVEWLLLGSQPRAAVVLLYLHSSVLGGIAISAFWSLLNERFDPHSAKPLMARVAGAATLGGFVGGVSAERVAALARLIGPGKPTLELEAARGNDEAGLGEVRAKTYIIPKIIKTRFDFIDSGAEVAGVG